MNEQDLHNDPWQEKMQEVPVPDMEESWKEMHLLLDREMPAVYKDDRLKWILLIVLLLCVGVCNCPGTGRRQAYRQNGHAKQDAAATSGAQKDTAARYPGPPANKRLPVHKPTVSGGPVTRPAQQGNQKGMNGRLPVITATDPGHALALKRRLSPDSALAPFYPGKNRQRPGDPGVPAASRKSKQVVSGKSRPVKINRAPEPHDAYHPRLSAPQQDTGKALPYHRTDSMPLPAANDTVKPALVNSPVEQGERTGNQPGKTTKKKSAERGWAAAIGVNHFLRIGRQQPAAFNSDGTSGVLADYIPVPQLRYYFSKKTYIQVEAQLNAPQYTRAVLLSEEVSDTSGARPGTRKAVFIKKLFYSNVPLSMHFSPFRNLYTGVGLQFSTLRNAVGLFDYRQLTPGRPDSIITEKVQVLDKEDTLFGRLKTNEWRFLLDVNYQWKRFTPGMRYNTAFTPFMNIRVSGVRVTQARNQSLQLYLRYVIWRRPKSLLSPAR